MHYIYKRGNLTCERQRDGDRQGQRQKDGLISHTKVGQFVSSLYFIKDLPQLAIVCGREKVEELCTLTPFDTLAHHVLACPNNYK